jgi:hypothetical protein
VSRKPTTEEVEPHYSPRVLAERFELTPAEVRKLFKPGKIWPVVRFNARVIRAPASSVNRYLAAKTFETRPL